MSSTLVIINTQANVEVAIILAGPNIGRRSDYFKL